VFRGPKSKNWDGGTVLDDTDMSGRRSIVSREDRKTALGCHAQFWARVLVAARVTSACSFLLTARVLF